MNAQTFAVALVGILVAPAFCRGEDPAPFIHRTANFVVEAADELIARSIAEKAEEHRRSLAVAWLGKELPAWKQPCTVRVAVSLGPPGGVTHFTYAPDSSGKSHVTRLSMELVGPIDIIVRGVLPHESAHAVLTSYFGRPLPRWADEGLAILCEPDDIQAATDRRLRDLVAQERALSVPRLLDLKDYPPDRYSVYAQGHSVARFLLHCRPRPDDGKVVIATGRRVLIRFVEVGLAEGWETAVKQVYGFDSVESLEARWNGWLRTETSRYSK
jgi:hypothetical protein